MSTQVPTGNFMDDFEAALAEDFYTAIQDATEDTERSVQASQFKIGISDLGFCPERTRRLLDGQTPDPVDRLAAWVGTALGDHAEEAWLAKHPDWIRQPEVEVEFKIAMNGTPYRIVIPGHPDLVDPKGLMLDVKTDMGLADIERTGPSLQQQFQRHCYGVACWNAGMFPGVQLEDVKVGNVWIDRSATEKRAHVNVEPLNLDVVLEAQDWLEDVLYHLVNGEEAQKVPPRDMCAVVCGHFAVCRALDTDVTGLIEDPGLLAHVEVYREGQVMETLGKAMKDSAKAHLEGVSGMAKIGDDLFVLRHTFVDASVVPEHSRRAYTKIELRKAPKPRVRKKA